MTNNSKRAKLLIFSDSHGSIKNMTQAMRLHAGSDVIIHLGDGYEDLETLKAKHPGALYLSVSGNAENRMSCGAIPALLFHEICGMRLMLCHGHKYGVQYGYEMLIAAAYKEKADIVLFGHTHRGYQAYIPREKSHSPAVCGNLRLFCPGSISKPRSGYPSYGIIEIRENGILMTNAEIK
ncbi:MAG: YfcE family phosphodiesterase [Eubacteriales bacterium]|jgi:putative phosphoesterase|nr:YfcE family phosphodiesterase [Eubacteriales bacterium]